MRQIILLPLLLLFMTTLYAQPHAKEVAAVNASITALFDALAARDLPKLKEYATPDIMILENGVVWNMDTISLYVNRLAGKEFKRINKLAFIRTEVKDNTAWVAYHNTAEITLEGRSRQVQWMESAVVVKEGNLWKVKLLHSTVLNKH